MSTIKENDFYNDVLARKVTRFLVFFQASTLFIGLILAFVKLSSVALFIAFISFVLILGALTWFYIRYKSYPAVQEKRKLNQHAKSLEAQILAHTTNIQLTFQNREKIEQAEKAERAETLLNLQKKHIESGMTSSWVANADIPGIGPALKQRLAAQGFTTAARISQNVTNVEGFGPSKTQAILDWRNRTYSHFDSTKPMVLPPEKHEEILKKYLIHHSNNNDQQHKLQEKKAILENARKEIQPRINQLAPFTFKTFLRHGLASQSVVAGIVGIGLLASNLCLGTSATISAIAASVPTATPTSTITLTPTFTYTATYTFTPTITFNPTITFTPTITYTPTLTFTPSKTFTPSHTITPTFTITLTAPSTSLIILLTVGYTLIPTQPSGGGCCKHCGSTSQPCGDSCISLKYTCHKAPGCACN